MQREPNFVIIDHFLSIFISVFRVRKLKIILSKGTRSKDVSELQNDQNFILFL